MTAIANVELIPSAPLRVQLHFGDKVLAADAAQVLGLCREAITGLQQRGKLGRLSVGGKIYVPWADVERMLRDGDGVVKGPRRRKQKAAA